MPKCLSSKSTFASYLFLFLFLLSTTSCSKKTLKKSDLITFYIKENTRINEIVGQIKAPGFFPPFDIHDFQDRKFVISKSTGIIRVAGPIDREKQDLYTFLIISANGETKSVEIRVTDVNDNEPKFNATRLAKSIPENYPIGSKVDLTTVYDPDEGSNSIRSVKITSGDSEKMFAIDYHDGANGVYYLRLIVRQILDYESVSQFNLVLQALDGGSPPLQATLIVTVLVQNANDNVPKFDISRYIVSVRESHPLNSSFLQVRATDNDAGLSGQLAYFVDDDQSFLSVDARSGALSLRRSLDYETCRSHHVSVGVRDGSPPFHTSKVPVIIDVIDVNDNRPEIQSVWTDGVARLYRNIDLNSIVAHIKVDDADAISTAFELKIVNRSPFQIVKILPKLWELRIIKDISDLEDTQLNLTLEARDFPEPSLSTVVTIPIALQWSLTKEISFSKRFYSVELDGPILQSNHFIIAPDIVKTTPTKSNFSFRLFNNDGLFKINEISGELSSNNFVDCGIYLLNVSLFPLKNRFPIDETQIQITVKSNRKVPLYFENTFLRIIVNPKQIQCFTQIAVNNRHCGMKVHYTFESLLKTEAPFRVHKQGVLCTAEHINNQDSQPRRYLYRIRAYDETNSSASCLVLFVVRPRTILRRIMSEINVTLPMNSAASPSGPIAKILVTFADHAPSDFRGFIQYQIVLDDDYATETVAVDSRSGDVTIRRYPLGKSAVTAKIKASTLDAISSFSIIILKIDFAEVYFTKSIYQFILDDQQIYSRSPIIGMVSTNQILVKYYFLNIKDDTTKFLIDPFTGKIKGQNLLDISAKSIGLTVYAIDTLGNICYAQVLIFLESRQRPPVFNFENLSAEIFENTPVGTEILQVIPSHTSETDTYEILPSSSSYLVSIHRRTGQIFVEEQLDRETIQFIVITVILTNQIGSTKKDIHLKILDINDNKPECKDSMINISFQDEAVFGTQTCPIQCFDPDDFINANLSFTLRMVSPPNKINPFRIQWTTGCLITISSLDIWETNPEGKFHLVATVSDNGPGSNLQTEVQIFIKIVDTNNHSPSLLSYNFFYIPENAAYGTEVGTLVVEDADKGLNGEVEISLKHMYYSHCFYVEKTSKSTFIIRSKNLSIINLNLGAHNVILKLTDKGSPPRSSSVNIIVHVDDTNKNTPEIIFPRQRESIIFLCPLMTGSELFVVKSIDHDQGLNCKSSYSFQMLTGNDDLISIDIWSGLVTNKEELSCFQNLKLRIHVSDLGNPRRSSFIDTTLKPYPITESSANFLNRNFTFIISDNSTAGLVIADLNIFPKHLGTKCLFSTNTSSTFDNILHIRYDTQTLILLNNDITKSKISYLVVATFHSAIYLPSSIIFYLNLIINRNFSPWPVFSSNSPKVLYVKENQPAGMCVGTFLVKNYENLAVKFSIRQPKKYFVINPQTGVLVTFRPFDRESEIQDNFSIEIIATHIGNPTRAGVHPVKVVILDENDNTPKIVSPVNYSVQVPLPGPSNISLFRIISKDEDIGSNAQLEYKISYSPENIFSIDQGSGDVWLLYTPKVAVYEVNVTVSDCGAIPRLVWRVFAIHFINKKHKIKLKLLSNTLSMNLSLPQNKAGFVIGKISHTEMTPENLDFRFHLIAGKFSQIFAIHPTFGDIRTQQPVTAESTGHSEIIQLSVIIQSVQDPAIYDMGKLLININYGNQHAPKFSRSEFNVKLPEDEAITDFLTIVAHDPDLGIYGKVAYRLNGDTYDQKIFIDPLTGRLSCSPLKFTEKSIYNLYVTATDENGAVFGRSNSVKVTILVQNNRQDPLEFNSTHFKLNVLENAPAGTFLGRINVKKRPVNAELTYILNPSHSYIQINSSTGELRTNGPLHREKFQFLDLTIHAFRKSLQTQAIQRASAIVDIRIIDINDNPPIPFENPVKCLIPNSLILPNPLAKLAATDLDKSSNITFRFNLNDLQTSSLKHLYNINSVSGDLFITSPVANTEKVRHILNVIVSDNGQPGKSVSVLVDISLNHDPESLQILPDKAIFRVTENSVPGTFIGQLKLLNNCTPGYIRFSIIDGVNHELIFLHEATGKIFVAVSGNIDREKIETIILWTQVICQATDIMGYKKVIIHVEDADDNQPVFSQSHYVAFLNEGEPPKTPLIRTTVYDPDIGINSQVDYFIEFYSSQEVFSIDSNGEVKTNIPLNFHTRSSYNLVIKATSKASPLIFAECRLTVYVININDQRPIITPSFQTIRLDTNNIVGSVITKITAKDSDGSDGISYRIRHQKISNQTLFLSITYDSGEIFLSRKLLVSDVGRHELDIIADDGKFSSSSVIHIHVMDNNNHIPILVENMQTVILSEDIKPGSLVLYLHAEDNDQGDNGKVNFELTSLYPWLALRKFQNNTASLYLLGKPQRQNSPFFLGIQLVDNSANRQQRLTSISSIAIIYRSTDHNPPVFLRNNAEVINISELTTSGTRIAKVFCKDIISGHSVTYKISNSSHFHVDMESGDIFLTNKLRPEIHQRFVVHVVCEVLDSSDRMSTFNLSVVVINKNNWLVPIHNTTINITLQISEIVQLPTLIFNLENSNRNSFYFYYYLLSITPEDPENIDDPPNFKIDTLKNIWLMDGNILQSKSWILTIMVLDHRKYQNTLSSLFGNGYIYLHITIPQRPMRNMKKCVDIDRLSGVVHENEPPLTTVLVLPNWYQDIKYTMAVNDNFELSCDKSATWKCSIKTKTILDFENKEQYRLQLLVTGSFSYLQSCSHVLMVEISVLDVDEFSPEFTQQSYRHNVEGDIPKLGQVLYTVHATDKDRGRFGLVYYQLINNVYENFGVKNDTGDIFIKSSFDGVKQVKGRNKRASGENQNSKSHKRAFQFRISASSGIKSSFAHVELSVLVPGDLKSPISSAHLSELNIILLATVPTCFVIIIIIFVIIFYIRRKKHSVIYKGSSCPSTRTESPKIANSWNTQPFLPTRMLPYPPNKYYTDSRKLPDIAQTTPLNYNTEYLPHSETQDFSLSGDEDKQLTTSSLENPNMFSHSSETSIKPEEQTSNLYSHEFNNNVSSYSEMNFDSEKAHGHRVCDYYDDSGMENKRISRVAFEQNKRYPDSNISSTSSSGYSAISHHHPNMLTKIPYNESMQNSNIPHNPVFVQNSSINMLRDGPINRSMVRNPRAVFGMPPNDKLRQAVSSTILKSNSDLSEVVPMLDMGQYYHNTYSDTNNIKHPNTLPMIPRYSDEEVLELSHYPYNIQPSVMVQHPHSTTSAISNNLTVPDTYTQPYSDITEI